MDLKGGVGEERRLEIVGSCVWSCPEGFNKSQSPFPPWVISKIPAVPMVVPTALKTTEGTGDNVAIRALHFFESASMIE